MIEAILDRKIDVAYALMQRIDTGVALSEVLPQFKLLAGLDDDEATQFLADLLMFNMLEIPGVKPPFKKLAQIQAMEIYRRLCSAPNIGEMSVDGRVEVKSPNEILEQDHVIPLSVFQMEHMERPLDLSPSMSSDLMDRVVRTSLYYKQVQICLSKIRSYMYDFASRIWQKSLEDKDYIGFLGPDYRLVIEYLGALDSEFANELTATLEGLRSENPASWSLSALGCRNVVLKLGSTLWQVLADEYYSTLLDRKITLRGDVEKNKLRAYVDAHWQVSDSGQKSLLKEAHELVQPIYDKGSKGKAGSKIRRSEAQKLVVDTFRLVDLLEQTTDLQPLTSLPPMTIEA